MMSWSRVAVGGQGMGVRAAGDVCAGAAVWAWMAAAVAMRKRRTARRHM
jgi:hypothetical protein